MKYKKTSALALLLALALAISAACAFAADAAPESVASEPTVPPKQMPGMLRVPTEMYMGSEDYEPTEDDIKATQLALSLMTPGYEDLTVGEFERRVKAAMDAGMYSLWQFYGTQITEELEQFLPGPLSTTMESVKFDEYYLEDPRHPGDPMGRLGMWSWEQDDRFLQHDVDGVSVNYWLGYSVLDPDGITVGERERIISAYEEAMNQQFESFSAEQILGQDPRICMREARDELTERLSTPAFRIRAVNFDVQYSIGIDSYYTPLSFRDNLEGEPPSFETADPAHAVVVRSDESINLCFGRDQQTGAGLISADGGQSFYLSGYRDPESGITFAYDPVTDVGQISPDNGQSWWSEAYPWIFVNQEYDAVLHAGDFQPGWDIQQSAEGYIAQYLEWQRWARIEQAQKDGGFQMPGSAWTLDEVFTQEQIAEQDSFEQAMLRELGDGYEQLSVRAFEQRLLDVSEGDLSMLSYARDRLYPDEDESDQDVALYLAIYHALVEFNREDVFGAASDALPGGLGTVTEAAAMPGRATSERGADHAAVHYLLSWQTLQPDQITVSERERVLEGYERQMRSFIEDMSAGQFFDEDPIEHLRAKRDELTEALSTPALRVRAINFRCNASVGGRQYSTPVDFWDTEHPAQPATTLPAGQVRKIGHDELLSLSYGTDASGLRGLVSPDEQTWYESGYRDPQGVCHRYDAAGAWRQISIDNGQSWWNEAAPGLFRSEDGRYELSKKADAPWRFSEIAAYSSYDDFLPIALQEALNP